MEGSEVVGIELDGKPTTIRPGTQGFRLIVEICQDELRRSDGVVDVSSLAQDTNIWSDKTLSEPEARRRLANLKHRHFDKCLVIGHTITLTARVELVQVCESNRNTRRDD